MFPTFALTQHSHWWVDSCSATICEGLSQMWANISALWPSSSVILYVWKREWSCTSYWSFHYLIGEFVFEINSTSNILQLPLYYIHSSLWILKWRTVRYDYYLFKRHSYLLFTNIQFLLSELSFWIHSHAIYLLFNFFEYVLNKCF